MEGREEALYEETFELDHSADELALSELNPHNYADLRKLAAYFNVFPAEGIQGRK